MESLKLTINMKGLSGSVAVPGDKSISHRSVMFGAISEGVTTVSNFLPGDDCLSTIACFRKLGVHIEEQEKELRITGTGFEGLMEPNEFLDVGNSGTTIRLMLGILAGRPFFASLQGDQSIGEAADDQGNHSLKGNGCTD